VGLNILLFDEASNIDM
jgi:hypothetical protein